MDSKAQLTVDIIAKVAEGKIDIVNAAKLLNNDKSRRTVERYLRACINGSSCRPADDNMWFNKRIIHFDEPKNIGEITDSSYLSGRFAHWSCTFDD